MPLPQAMREGPELIDMSKVPEEEREAIAKNAFYTNMAQLAPMLAQMLGGLRGDVINLTNMMGSELTAIRYMITPPMDKFHVPAIFPLDPAAPDHRFRVYCLACSELTGQFTYPCLVGNEPERDVAPMPCSDVMHIPPSMRGKAGPLIIWEKDLNKEAHDAPPDSQDPGAGAADADTGAEGDSPEGLQLPGDGADEALPGDGDGVQPADQ